MPSNARLDSLRILTPCDVDWSSMKGDDAVRFCGKCQQNVYNVARLSNEEALNVIERAEGRVCLRLTRRRDGTIATGDCWARLRRARRRGVLAFLAVLPLVVLMQLWSQAFGLRALYGFFNAGPCRVPTAGAGRMMGERMGAPMPLPPPRVTAPPLEEKPAPSKPIIMGRIRVDLHRSDPR